MAELEENGVALPRKEVDLPDLTSFEGVELFDVKRELWAG